MLSVSARKCAWSPRFSIGSSAGNIVVSRIESGPAFAPPGTRRGRLEHPSTSFHGQKTRTCTDRTVSEKRVPCPATGRVRRNERCRKVFTLIPAFPCQGGKVVLWHSRISDACSARGLSGSIDAASMGIFLCSSAVLYSMSDGEAVLDFWLAGCGADGALDAAKRRMWFGDGRKHDAAIRERFGALHARAAAGELERDWAAGARGRLALIVLLDQ